MAIEEYRFWRRILVNYCNMYYYGCIGNKSTYQKAMVELRALRA